MNKLNRNVYSGMQILAMCMMIGNVNATLYKWVDAEGNTNYTETRPVDFDFEEIQPPPEVDTETAIEQLKADQKKANDLERQRKAKAENQKIDEQNAIIKKKNCEMARERLASYARPGVRLVQEDGSRIRATEEQRQEQIAISNDMIKKFCN